MITDPPRMFDLEGITEEGPALLPLDAGEQYRFGFAMEACIGCHSCEVACAEQNATPVDLAWRHVGELEGGTFPETRRFNLSMACNHCLEPTCLSGCPTKAYVKLSNGVVKHQADECIGCQYCIWNCPYEVPVFNPERRVVSKCDMCLPRLEAGEYPACVMACPTHAITVEVVDVGQWRADHREADAPGLPPSSITLSTTRLSMPADLPDDLVAANDHRVELEDPHWPLVILTLLTQLSLGAMASTVFLEFVGAGVSGVAGGDGFAGGAVGAFLAGALAMSASFFHLGRPAYAFKALRNVRTSWMSREVVLFGAFATTSLVYAGAWSLDRGLPTVPLGVLAVVVGLVGVYASGRLYLVPARPVWKSQRTMVSFFATALALGPLFALSFLERGSLESSWMRVLLVASLGGVLAQLAALGHLVHAVRSATDHQYRGTGYLLLKRCRGLFALRLLAAGAGLAMVASLLGLPLDGDEAAGRLVMALVVLGAGELAGRYLFFVTVVPYRVAGSFFGRHR